MRYFIIFLPKIKIKLQDSSLNIKYIELKIIGIHFSRIRFKSEMFNEKYFQNLYNIDYV